MTANIVTNTQDDNKEVRLPVEEVKSLIDTGKIYFHVPQDEGIGYARSAPIAIFEPFPMATIELYHLIKKGEITTTPYRTKSGRIAFAWNPEFTGGKA